MTNNHFDYFSKSNATKWKKIRNARIAIIKTQWNAEVVSRLAAASEKLLIANKIKYSVFEVAGAFEIPTFIRYLAKKGHKISGVVALGCVIRGETIHFEVIAHSVATAIQDLNLTLNLPTSFGVLTPNTLEQAHARSLDNEFNKGYEATAALLDLLYGIKCL